MFNQLNYFVIRKSSIITVLSVLFLMFTASVSGQRVDDTNDGGFDFKKKSGRNLDWKMSERVVDNSGEGGNGGDDWRKNYRSGENHHTIKQKNMETKTKLIKIRCTKTEKIQLQNRAKKAGLNLSEFCRELSTKGRVLSVPSFTK